MKVWHSKAASDYDYFHVEDDEGNEIGRSVADRRTPRVWYIGDSFVIPERRCEGIYDALFTARMEYIQSHDPLLVVGIANAGSYSKYKKWGFITMIDHDEYEYNEWVCVKDYTS
jgi:hypothetical protein